MGFTQTCFIHVLLTLLSMLTDAEDIITVKATKGQKIPLHCDVSHNSINETYTVNWRRNGTSLNLCYYRVSDNTITGWNCRSHYVTEGQPPQLYLTEANFSDSGVYCCTVRREIPQPVLDNVKLVNLTLQGVIIEKQNISQDYMELLCRTEGLNQDQLTFHWTWGTSGKYYNKSQRLNLSKSDWSDCDMFTCSVSQNHTLFSDTFDLAVSTECSTGLMKSTIIMYVLPPAGVAFISVIICCCCICQKKKKKEGTNIVQFNNKIYENFSFSSPGPASSIHEECIYEN